jgi:hypothetical protein
MLMIEFACDADSECGKIGLKEFGVNVIRATRNDGDLSIPNGEGINRLIKIVEEHEGPVYLHASLPCTPWTSLQHINISMHGAQYLEKLEKQTKRSLRMFQNFLTLARLVKSKNGVVSFEWPPSATGWRTKPFQKMVEWLDLYVEIHGCSVGVRSIHNEPILKPYAFSTDNPWLYKELLKCQCSKDHVHVPCEGSETTRTGHYPAQLARILLKCFVKAVTEREIEVARREREELKANLLAVATQEETKAFLDLSKKEQARLVEAARKVRINTGHRSPEMHQAERCTASFESSYGTSQVQFLR